MGQEFLDKRKHTRFLCGFVVEHYPIGFEWAYGSQRLQDYVHELVGVHVSHKVGCGCDSNLSEGRFNTAKVCVQAVFYGVFQRVFTNDFAEKLTRSFSLKYLGAKFCLFPIEAYLQPCSFGGMPLTRSVSMFSFTNSASNVACWFCLKKGAR